MNNKVPTTLASLQQRTSLSRLPVNNRDMKLGLDSMAAVNLIRADAVPQHAVVQLGGPLLHGVGQAQANGKVTLHVSLGSISIDDVSFVVVDTLPVDALLGKPTLANMQARLDLGSDTATLQHSAKQISVQAIALPTRSPDSSRPQAQSYWNWVNRRLAAAPKRFQTLVQDIFERADDKMLEQFLAEFPEWAARRLDRLMSPTSPPTPYQEQLRRPNSVTTGLAVCTIVEAHTILQTEAGEHDLTARADDNRDFLPPIMSFEEEVRKWTRSRSNWWKKLSSHQLEKDS